MSPFVAWKPKRVPNGAIVMNLEGVDRAFALKAGESFAAAFPSTARFRMDPDYKRNTIPVDCYVNVSRAMLCSERATAFIRSHSPAAVEYLPVQVLDHKGKPLSGLHFIVHPIDPPDCIDVGKSDVTWSAVEPSEVQMYEHLEIDERRVPADRLLFRPKGCPSVLALRRDFAEAIVKQGFSGARWVEID